MKLDSDLQRMIFGFVLLLILAILTGAIALGKVEEKTSYGLMPLVTTFSTLAGPFANYAFGRREKGKDDGDHPSP